MSPGKGHCLSKEFMQNEGGKRLLYLFHNILLLEVFQMSKDIKKGGKNESGDPRKGKEVLILDETNINSSNRVIFPKIERLTAWFMRPNNLV